jgi:hypothetical protein
MKKIILGLCLLTTTGIMYAGTSAVPGNVPLKVRQAFHREYKHVDVSTAHWQQSDGKWEASFISPETNTNALARYDFSGHHVNSRIELKQDAMPAKVIDRLNEKFPNHYEHSFTRIERPWKKDLYKVKVKEKGTSRTLYLDKMGNEKDYAGR